MIDRWGTAVRVGWLAHEVLWVRAALTLPFHSRRVAFHDIASLTGRPLGAVETYAYRLKAKDKRLKAVVGPSPYERAIRPPVRLPVALPSELRGPTKAQLTGGNARVSRRQPLIMAAE